MKSYSSSCIDSCYEQAETLIYESKAHLRVSVFARNPFLLFHAFTKAAPLSTKSPTRSLQME